MVKQLSYRYSFKGEQFLFIGIDIFFAIVFLFLIFSVFMGDDYLSLYGIIFAVLLGACIVDVRLQLRSKTVKYDLNYIYVTNRGGKEKTYDIENLILLRSLFFNYYNILEIKNEQGYTDKVYAFIYFRMLGGLTKDAKELIKYAEDAKMRKLIKSM